MRVFCLDSEGGSGLDFCLRAIADRYLVVKNLPNDLVFDRGHQLVGNAKLTGNFSLRSRFVENGEGLILRNLCCSVILAAWRSMGFGVFSVALAFARNMSPLCYHIVDVVDLCSKKQMIWSNAFRVITAVKDTKVIRYFAISHDPRYSVRRCVGAAGYADRAIPLFLGLGPKPARFRLLNHVPKSFLTGGGY